MPQVQVIQPIQQQLKRLRVAAYARVSTKSNEQLHSMSVQTEYYEDLIQKNPNWEFVGVYADEGTSGTSIKHRTELNRLMEDCRAGMIDRILVKSASRMARNTVDLLTLVRELKSIGVTVQFEKEQFDTDSATGEMMLSMMCAIAQEESLSISKNMKWGIRKKMQAGTYVNCATPFGYRQQDHQLVLEKDEAAVVRLVFEKYLSGVGIAEIARYLNENHPKEGGWWYTSAVRFMLHNEAYKGDTLHQKHYTTDTLPFMVYHNEGQFPKYCAYKSHVAIVSDEDFDKVQQLLKTKQMSVPNAAPRVFTKKIYCAECGTVFAQASRANGAVAWGCRKHLNKSSLCPVKSVYETELCRAFLYMYNKLQANRARIFRPMVDSLLLLKSQQEHQNAARESIYAEIQRLAKQNHNLERIHAQGYIEDTQYIERKTLIEQQLDEKRVQLSRTSISKNVEQTLKSTRQIEKILDSGPPLTYFDEHTFTEMVKKVSASNTAIEFELINGMKLSEERTEK